MRAGALLIWAAVACSSPLLCAAPAPPGATPTASEAARTLRQMQMLLGVPGAPEPTDPVGVLAKVKERLLKTDETALADVRGLLGLGAAVPSPQYECAALEGLRRLAGLSAAAAPGGGTIGSFGVIPPAPVSHPYPHFLERSQMFFLLHDVDVEAQLAPHIFFDNVSDPGPDVTAVGRRGFYTADGRSVAFMTSFTPMIRLRMLKGQSSPIKTLSWMPKLDGQLFVMGRPKDNETWGDGAVLTAFQFRWGHHSNGQDECIYQAGVLDRPDLCPKLDASDTSKVSVNYPNGSFSTNYLQFGVARKWYRLVPDDERSERPQRTIAAGLSFEINPAGLPAPFFVPSGTMDGAQRALYGGNRVHVTGELDQRLGRPSRPSLLRGTLHAGLGVDFIDKVKGEGPLVVDSVPDGPLNAVLHPGLGSSRWRFSGELAWLPDGLRGWGLQGRYLHGQDYYNLQFVRDIHWLRLGVVFDAGEFERFYHRKQTPP